MADTNIVIDLKEISISFLALLVVYTFWLLKFPSKPFYLLRFSFVTLIELCFRSSDLFLNKIHPWLSAATKRSILIGALWYCEYHSSDSVNWVYHIVKKKFLMEFMISAFRLTFKRRERERERERVHGLGFHIGSAFIIV